MRKIISLFLFGVFITNCFFAQAGVVEPNEWDFGRVKQGQILKHDFLFKNQTKGVLKIINVNTSCGCTASQADKQSLKPGESTTISVTFNSKKYSGEIRQFVYVNTDNADSSVVKFIIKAEVLREGN